MLRFRSIALALIVIALLPCSLFGATLDSVISSGTSAGAPQSYLSNLTGAGTIDTGTLGLNTWVGSGTGETYNQANIVPSEGGGSAKSIAIQDGYLRVSAANGTTYSKWSNVLVYQYNGISNNVGVLFSTGQVGVGGAQGFFDITINAGQPQINATTNGTGAVFSAPYNFVVGQTYLIVTTFDSAGNGTFTVYINGTQVGQLANMGLPIDAGNWVWGTGYNLDWCANGNYERMAFYGNKILTGADDIALYNAYLGTDSVAIVSPNGGQTFGTLQTIAISGTVSGSTVPDVDVYWTTDGGTTKNLIASSVAVSSSSWNTTWAGAHTAGSTYKIYVQKTGDATINALSASNFTIATSTLTINAPLCPKIANYPSAVTWSAFGLDTVNVLLSIDGGATYPYTLASNVNASLGRAKFWVVPAYVSSNCKIEVVGAGSATAATSTFSIVSETNSVLQPTLTPGSGPTAFAPPGFSTATATPNLTGGAISSFTIDSPGDGYYSVPTVLIGDAGDGMGHFGTGATGTAVLSSTGSLGYANLTNRGSGYTDGIYSLSLSGGGGTGAACLAVVSGGSVNSVIVTNCGTAYTSAPAISFSGLSGGSGAAASGVLQYTVASITVTNGGSGYFVPQAAITQGRTTIAVPNCYDDIVPGEAFSAVRQFGVGALSATTDVVGGTGSGDSIPGVECVYMRANGGPWVAIPQPSLNSSSVRSAPWTPGAHMHDNPAFSTIRATQEYCATLDPTGLAANTQITIQSYVVPFSGTPKALADVVIVANPTEHDYYVDSANGLPGGTGASNSPLDTIAHVITAAVANSQTEGLHIKCKPGSYTFDSNSGTTGTITTVQPITVEPAPGVTFGQAKLIGLSGTVFWRVKSTHVKDMLLDWTDPTTASMYTDVAGSAYWFDGCEIKGAGPGDVSTNPSTAGPNGFDLPYITECYVHDVGGSAVAFFDVGAVLRNTFNWHCGGKMGGESTLVQNFYVKDLLQLGVEHSDVLAFVVCNEKVALSVISENAPRMIAPLFPLPDIRSSFINIDSNTYSGNSNFSTIGGQSCLYAYCRFESDTPDYADHYGPNMNQQVHACIFDTGASNVDPGNPTGPTRFPISEATWTYNDYGSGTSVSADANATSGSVLTYNADRTPVAGNTSFSSGIPDWPFDALNHRRGLYTPGHWTAKGPYAAAAEYAVRGGSGTGGHSFIGQNLDNPGMIGEGGNGF